MVKYKYNTDKRKRVVRDIFTGKIISDKEAVSLDNIHLILEKEGLVNREI